MYDSLFDLEYIFFSIIVLIVSAGLAGSIINSSGTNRSKAAIINILLLLIIGVQYYYLIGAITVFPSNRFFMYDSNQERHDCVTSDKGGKRPGSSKLREFQNPCFCYQNATCVDAVHGFKIKTSLCPFDGTTRCIAFNGVEIPKHVSAHRDCTGGMHSRCTKDEPCTPCDRDKLILFGASRCGSCSQRFQGDCNFIPDIGPYCYKYPNSKEIEPCKKCCTDPEPLIVDNICY